MDNSYSNKNNTNNNNNNLENSVHNLIVHRLTTNTSHPIKYIKWQVILILYYIAENNIKWDGNFKHIIYSTIITITYYKNIVYHKKNKIASPEKIKKHILKLIKKNKHIAKTKDTLYINGSFDVNINVNNMLSKANDENLKKAINMSLEYNYPNTMIKNKVIKKKVIKDTDLNKAIKLSINNIPDEIYKNKIEIEKHNRSDKIQLKPLNIIPNTNDGTIKYCPYCRVPIIKNGGCSHIKCPNCLGHFYWENAL